MKKRYSFFIVIILLGCTNNTLAPTPIDLNGKWVEINSRKDTIIFDRNIDSDDRRLFIFKGQNEIKGYSKLYSSIYEYKVKGEKISIYNTLSSCYCFTDYTFKPSIDKFFIENFYSQNSNGQLETFERVE